MEVQKPKESGRPWWSGKLQFECTACGKCCESRGGYQFVMVNDDERRRMASFLQIPISSFTRKYTYRTNFGFRTLRFRNGACIFLKDGLCQVHEVKPTQCRTWPFWQENLNSFAEWKSEVLDFCPGSNQGPIISDDLIMQLAKEAEGALEI